MTPWIPRRPPARPPAASDDASSPFWIAYADLMAGIFLVFLLMLITALHHHARAQQRIRDDMERNLKEQEEKLHKIRRMSEEISRLRVAVRGGQDAIAKFLEEQRLRTEKIAGLEIRIRTLEEERTRLEGTVTAQGDSMRQDRETLSAREIEIARLTVEISRIQDAFTSQLHIIEEQARKIRTLFGVRKSIVDELTRKFTAQGQDLELVVDPASGAIQLGGGILFDESSAEIRPEARARLETFVTNYLEVLLGNPDILKYLAQIIIEGHTNDNGTYLNNLRLSQNRSRAVMEALLAMDTPNRALLEKYVIASGRSFSMPVLDSGGQIDMVRSRRIEFKFRLRDEEAVQELGEVLQSGGR